MPGSATTVCGSRRITWNEAQRPPPSAWVDVQRRLVWAAAEFRSMPAFPPMVRVAAMRSTEGWPLTTYARGWSRTVVQLGSRGRARNRRFRSATRAHEPTTRRCEGQDYENGAGDRLRKRLETRSTRAGAARLHWFARGQSNQQVLEDQRRQARLLARSASNNQRYNWRPRSRPGALVAAPDLPNTNSRTPPLRSADGG